MAEHNNTIAAVLKKDTPKTPANGFTDAFLQRVKPTDKRYELADKGQRGLRLRVSPSGSRTFVWYYRTGKTTKCHTIGPYPQINLATARKEVRERKDKLVDGVVPLAKSDGAPKTAKDLGELFYEHRIKGVRKRPEAVQQILNHDIYPAIGSKSLRAITLAMLSGIIDTVVARGANVHAGKVLSLTKQMFLWGEAKGYIERSPGYALKADTFAIFRGQKDRALDVNQHGDPQAKLTETATLWAYLDGVKRVSPQILYGLKVLLLTGVRSQELRLARWSNVDLENGIMTVPVSDQKLNPKQVATAKPWQVPLPPLAIEQLEQLRYHSRDSKFVLPGLEGDAPLSDKALTRAVARFFTGKRVLEIEKFSPHDLRRTLRTHLGRLKVPPHIAEACLHHSLGQMVQIYDTSSYLDERRDALSMWNDCVELAINPVDNVAVLEVANG